VYVRIAPILISGRRIETSTAGPGRAGHGS